MIEMKISRHPTLAKMSPGQFARNECANMLHDGVCLGVHVDSLVDHGQPKTCTPKNRCRVAEGKRCEYFERVILPLADQPSPHGDPHLQQKRAAARSDYLAMHAMARSGAKPCPLCVGAKPPKYQFCESCGTLRRREMSRNRMRRCREADSPVGVAL
jgi:hypothetical protein